jgi:hypothetical protein
LEENGMKKAILFLMMCIVFTACGEAAPEAAEILTTPPSDDGTPPTEGNELVKDEDEFPSSEGWQASAEREPDGVVEDPEVIEHGFTWFIEPKLEYDEIAICLCDLFFAQKNGEWFPIEAKTGETTNIIHEFGPCKSGSSWEWLYESELNLIGHVFGQPGVSEVEFYPFEEFAEWFTGIIVVEKIESPELQVGADSWYWHSYVDITFSGKFAVLDNGEFVTDFIYTKGENGLNDATVAALVNKESMHGIIGRGGEVIIPFLFNKIIINSENTAFARLARDDFWGIISF